MNAAVLLRQKVLDLAIRGKLTKREKDDEPASALLARIVAEKEKRNAKVGRVRTSAVPQPIPDDEKPFELPNGWVWAKLGELGIWKAGGTPSRSHSEYYRNGDIPWLKTGDLNDGFISDIPEKITKRGLESTSARVNAPGSVLMAMYGATIGKLGILAIPAATNQACCACDLLNCAEPEYLFYYLMAQRHAFIQLGGGGAQANISKEIIVNYQVPVPPVEEQRRIVARIKELLAAFDTYSTAMGKLSDSANLMEKKVLDLAIRGKLSKREKGDGSAAEIIADIEAENAGKQSDKKRKDKALPSITPDDEVFDLPENWTWCRMGSLVEIVSGVSYQKGDIRNDGIRILRGGNLKEDNRLYLNDDDVFISKSYANVENTVHKGDIVIVASTGSATVIGRPAIAEADMPGVQIGAFLRIVRSRKEELAKWLQLIFRSNFYRNHIRESSQGTNINNLKNEYITEFCIPLPPLAEQKRIVERVDAILAECRKVSR